MKRQEKAYLPRVSVSYASSLSRHTWIVPLILLLATGTLLGISTNLAKLAAQAGLAPLAFLTWSLVGATVVLTGIAAYRRQLAPLTARSSEYFIVAGLISVAAPNLLFFSAIPRVGASFVALVIAFPPFLTYLGALLLGMERFKTRRAIGVALALAGAITLALLKLSEPNAETFWIILTLSGSLLLACGNLYRTLRWPQGAMPAALAPGVLAASALMLILFGTLLQTLGAPATLSLTVPVDRPLPLLFILAQVATFSLQYLLFFMLQKRGGPVYLSLLGSVGAIVAVPIAVYLFSEALPQGLTVAGVLIALGVSLLTVGKSTVRRA